MAWKTKATKGGGGDYEKPPAGNHLARLIGMFDLGTQEQEYNGEKKELHRVQWVWELLNEQQAGSSMNHVIGLELTWSLNEKAKMRKLIEARTGKQIPDGTDYDILQELGQPCLLNVVQNGDYTKVDGVSAVPKGMTAPASQRDPVALDLDELKSGSVIPDWAPYIYGEAPMDVVKRCEEWANGQSGQASGQAAQPASQTQTPAQPTTRRPPPRRKEMEPSYYLSVNEDADPVLVPMSRLKEIVAEKGKEAFAYQVCPETGEEWKPLQEAIPESAGWSPF